MDLLLISDENKSDYVYSKDLNRFMCNKTKNIKKKMCEKKAQLALKIISNNYLFLLKFMLILSVFRKESKAVIKIMAYTQKHIKHIFLAVLPTKLFVLIITSVKKLLFTEEKWLFIGSLKQFVMSMIIVKK